jgi:hypothetical protein
VGRPLLAFALVSALAATVAAGPERGLPETAPGVYAADPGHLWNRLHEALFVRIAPDGREYGRDRIEPLLWRGSKHLLAGESHDRLLGVLAEFNRGGDRLIGDPVRRAMLQRDLWQVFSWLEHSHDEFYGFGGNAADWRVRQERLRQPLALAIGRLALAPRELEALPDNYAAAVASGRFAPQFDPAHPEKPYLPPDLFAADGRWIPLGRGKELIAPTHVVGDNPFTTSAFLIFISLPGGRRATLDYVAALGAFAQPTMLGPFPRFNPAIPQFPAGTQVALVRRALVVTAAGDIEPGPLTESVQVRVYRDVPLIRDGDFERAMLINDRMRSQQAMFEFVLSRQGLFGGAAGGLCFSPEVDDGIRTGFSTHGVDVLESWRNEASRSGAVRRPVEPTEAATHFCVNCHTLPGVYSLNAIAFATDRNVTRRRALVAASVPDVLATGADWKRRQPDWTLLKRLIAAQPRVR